MAGTTDICIDLSPEEEGEESGELRGRVEQTQGRVRVEAGEAVSVAGVASSLDVEVIALRLAVGLASQAPGAERVVICTDSRSALEGLRLLTDLSPT